MSLSMDTSSLRAAHTFALLAMDSYNVGYSPTIDRPAASAPGWATNFDPHNPSGIFAPVTEEWKDASFYAQAYQLDGRIVISYRGTDNVIADLSAWTGGAGYHNSAQSKLAFEYALTISNHANVALKDIVFTGHSLGGGLAGYVASMVGAQAIVFDTMPFLSAAQNLFNQPPSTPWSMALKNRIMVDGVVPAPDASRIIHHYVKDEILSTGTGTNSYPLSHEIDSHVGDLGLNLGWRVDLHSQALLVLLKFAEMEKIEGWENAARHVWTAFFDERNAIAAGYSGEAKPGSAMNHAIAYSTILEGYQPFGTTAARALFDDARDLAGAMARDLFSSTSSGEALFANLMNINAGARALVGDRSGANGLLELDARGLVADLAAINAGMGVVNLGGMTGLADFVKETTALRADTNDIIFRRIVSDFMLPQWLQNQANGFVVAAESDFLGGAASDLIFSTRDGVTLSGGGGSDLLVGGLGNVLSGGSGDDYLIGNTSDTALFNGRWIDYAIHHQGLSTHPLFVVEDRYDRDGKNIVLGVGNYLFEGDGAALLAHELLNVAPIGIDVVTARFLREGNYKAGTEVLLLEAIDPNRLDEFTWWLGPAAREIFEITARTDGTAAVSFARDVQLDYTTWAAALGQPGWAGWTAPGHYLGDASCYAFNVTVADYAGLTVSREFVLGIERRPDIGLYFQQTDAPVEGGFLNRPLGRIGIADPVGQYDFRILHDPHGIFSVDRYGAVTMTGEAPAFNRLGGVAEVVFGVVDSYGSVYEYVADILIHARPERFELRTSGAFGYEDAMISLDGAIAVSGDFDWGSLSITGLPNGASFHHLYPSWNVHEIAGGLRIDGSAAEINSFISGLSVIGRQNCSDDFRLNVALSGSDGGLRHRYGVDVAVQAVTDDIMVDKGTVNIAANTWNHLGNFDWRLFDNDGSESVSRVRIHTNAYDVRYGDFGANVETVNPFHYANYQYLDITGSDEAIRQTVHSLEAYHKGALQGSIYFGIWWADEGAATRVYHDAMWII